MPIGRLEPMPRDGRLVPLLPDCADERFSPPRTIDRSRRLSFARVRAFIDFARTLRANVRA